MTISEKIFAVLRERGMSQKEFSEMTGISQSTISEWKSKRTNPTSEKIMSICQVLGVTPEWLLSGTDAVGERSKELSWYVVGRDSELGGIITSYQGLNEKQRDRLLGYLDALKNM